MIKDAEFSPGFTVRTWHHFGVTNSPNLQLNCASMQTKYLEGVPEESFCFHLTTIVNTWSLPDVTGLSL